MELNDYIISNPTRGIPGLPPVLLKPDSPPELLRPVTVNPVRVKPEGGPDIWIGPILDRPVTVKPVTTNNDPDPLPVEKVVKPNPGGPDGELKNCKPVGGGGGPWPHGYPTDGEPWPFREIPDPIPFDNEEKVI